VSAASAFGWHVFLPRRFQLVWDGNEIHWRVEGQQDFVPLRSVHYPGFDDAFDAAAPEPVRGFAPAFLAASVQAGTVQIWPGSLAQTAPGWSLLVRPVANLPRPSGYELYEGIIETDHWLGPLFTNVRLTRTNVPIEFDDDVPFMQVQPLCKSQYADGRLDDYNVVADFGGLTPDDWRRYAQTVVEPCSDPERRRGAYAARVRKAAAGRRTEVAP
ncbi:MAG: DUF6065 family protein, partial [Hyphomicrobiaceae bacterium]